MSISLKRMSVFDSSVSIGIMLTGLVFVTSQTTTGYIRGFAVHDTDAAPLGCH